MPKGPDAPTTLIISQHPALARLLHEAAMNRGWHVESRDQATAWETYQQLSPQMVIVDWDLPESGCLSLCQRIRQAPGGPYRTILLVADQPSAIDHGKALLAGASFCMDQTVSQESLDIWLTIAQRGMEGMLASEQSLATLDRYRQEMEDVNSQLEDSIERANQMAMEAERAYIEVNQIFKTVAGGIALINNDCEVLRYNETFLSMAKVSASEAKTRKCYESFHSSMCHTPECPLTKIKNGEKRVESQIEKLADNGDKVFYSIVSTPFRGLGGELLGMVEHISDITTRVQAEIALKESEAKYKELSIVDELTGLFNKRHFNEVLRYECDKTRRYKHPPLSMIIMDIDNFKHFNDTYGHAEGDRVLAVMGQVVAQSIRLVDSGNRYGGEEFTVILPATSGTDAILVAERIRTRFAAHDFYPRNGEKVNKTVSIGITEYRPADDTPESLIKRADANLYKAKTSGKNRYVLE